MDPQYLPFAYLAAGAAIAIVSRWVADVSRHRLTRDRWKRRWAEALKRGPMVVPDGTPDLSRDALSALLAPLTPPPNRHVDLNTADATERIIGAIRGYGKDSAA